MRKRVFKIFLAFILLVGFLPTLEKPAKAAPAGSELLKNVSYVGDPSICKMDAKMANAYADAIAGVIASKGEAGTKAFLLDISDDGYPLLVTVQNETIDSISFISEFDIWTWDGKAASRYPVEDDSFSDWCGELFIGYCDGVPILLVTEWMEFHSEGAIYTVSNAQLSLLHHIVDYAAFPSGDPDTGYIIPYLTEDMQLSQNPTRSELLAAGWTDVGENWFTLTWLDGQYGKFELDLSYTSKYSLPFEELVGAPGYSAKNCSAGATVQSALRSYAQALSSKKEVLPFEMLENVAYYGDPSICKMDAKMANAYADAIERWRTGFTPERDDTYVPYAVLIDYAGDGMPLLMTVDTYGTANSDWSDVVWNDGAVYPFIWTYDGSKAREPEDLFDLYFIKTNGMATLCEGDLFHTTMYSISNAQLTPIRKLEFYHARHIDEITARGNKIPLVDTWKDERGDDNAYISDMLAAGWTNQGFGGSEYVLCRYNGEYCNYDSGISSFYNGTEIGWECFYADEDGAILNMPAGLSTADTLKSALRSYAQALSTGEKSTERNVSSNLKLDFSKIQTESMEEIIIYLQDSLDRMEGASLNDPAKATLALYCENAIAEHCGQGISGGSNRLTVAKGDVSKLVKQASRYKRDLENLLSSNGISLNKSLVVLVRLSWQDLDSGKACQINLDPSLAAALKGCTVQILLGDTQHYLQISSADLQKLINEYGSISVQLFKEKEGVYTINFLTPVGQIIDRIETGVTFALPAPDPLSTVEVTYNGGADNWGGQYDPIANVIAFEAHYSGQYSVLKRDQNITDIENLSDESRDAISFLVSKGYFSLDDTMFNPDAKLSRYDFTKALVGMFFALDRSITTSFPDVDQSSGYYAYVASGQKGNIISGFEDGTFRGDTNTTVEQMLALAARTLIERKGYILPHNPDSYLTGFADKDTVSAWAKEAVAMTVRDGIMDYGSTLSPQEQISRGQAALILYRLFKLLYETPAIALELPPESNTLDSAAVAAIAGGSTALLCGGAFLWYYLKKKKTGIALGVNNIIAVDSEVTPVSVEASVNTETENEVENSDN